MNPSATQEVREWLESDLMALIHVKHCIEKNQGPEQIAGFLKAVVNTMIEKGEWEIDPEQVNWMEVGNEASIIFSRRAQGIINDRKASARSQNAGRTS